MTCRRVAVLFLLLVASGVAAAAPRPPSAEQEFRLSVARDAGGGLVLDWVRQTLRPDAGVEELLALAADVPAGCDGLLALPHLLALADAWPPAVASCLPGPAPMSRPSRSPTRVGASHQPASFQLAMSRLPHWRWTTSATVHPSQGLGVSHWSAAPSTTWVNRSTRSLARSVVGFMGSTVGADRRR